MIRELCADARGSAAANYLLAGLVVAGAAMATAPLLGEAFDQNVQGIASGETLQSATVSAVSHAGGSDPAVGLEGSAELTASSAAFASAAVPTHESSSADAPEASGGFTVRARLI